MATKRQQTMAKREREQAVKEKRARKAARKAERVAAAAAGEIPEWMLDENGEPLEGVVLPEAREVTPETPAAEAPEEEESAA